MIDHERIRHLLDEARVGPMDPLRGTWIDFAQRPMEEQMLHLMMGQHKLTTKVDLLEQQLIESSSKAVKIERVRNGFVSFCMLAAYVAYATLGSPVPEWPN